MKLNIAYPVTGAQKIIEFEDERKVAFLMEKRLAQEVDGESIGPEFKGYLLRISGGQDKQGFPMKQGVLVNGRVRLLLSRGTLGFQKWRGRSGERRRKSVRGCIIGADIAIVHLVITKKGDAEVPGLTDKVIPRRLGPKRASKIRRLFNLTQDDDVRKFVIRRKIEKNGKTYYKAPKIQRLVTPERLQRKRLYRLHQKQNKAKSAAEAARYAELLAAKKAQRKRKAGEAEVAPVVATPAPAPVAAPAAQPAKKGTAAPVVAQPAAQPTKAAAPAAQPAKAAAQPAAQPAKPAAAQPTKAAAPAAQPTKAAAQPAAQPAKPAAQPTKAAAAPAAQPAAKSTQPAASQPKKSKK